MHRSIFTVLLMPLALLGCQSLDTRPNIGPCPSAGALYEAQRLIQFAGSDETYDNIGFTGEINAVTLKCRYVDDLPIQAQLEIDFAFGKGPAAKGHTFEYRYFVAVTRRNRAVIAKHDFPIRIKFDPDNFIMAHREVIEHIEIPRATNTVSGANFEILVGFELTEKERQFNRQGKRFRLNS